MFCERIRADHDADLTKRSVCHAQPIASGIQIMGNIEFVNLAMQKYEFTLLVEEHRGIKNFVVVTFDDPAANPNVISPRSLGKCLIPTAFRGRFSLLARGTMCPA